MSPIPITPASLRALAERLRQPRLAAFARWAGWAVMLAAFAYLAAALARLNPVQLLQAQSPAVWLTTSLAAAGYGFLLLLLVRGWSGIADRAGTLTTTDPLRIYGPAVIAKYLPGSIFQYAARQVTGARLGLAQADMARASLAEAAMHAPAALLAAGTLYAGGGWAGLGVCLASGVAIGRLAPSALWRAAGCQIAFFAGFALLVLLIADHATVAQAPEKLAGAFMVAWVAGFLIPIAPGGLGVREAALLALAGPWENAAVVGLFALLTRVVTTLGDLLIGLSAYGSTLRRRRNKQASA